MSVLKKALFLLLLSIQHINILCEVSIIDIRNEDEMNINNSANNYKFHYNYNYSNISANNILYIVANTSKFSVPAYLYASYNESVNENDRKFSSQDLGPNHLYIELERNETDLYIFLSCPIKDKDAQISIKALQISNIEISEDNPKAKFKLSHDFIVNYKFPNLTAYTKVLLYAYGEDWDFFEMEGQYVNSTKNNVKLESSILLETGYGVIIDLNNVDKSKEINITLSPYESRKGRKVIVGFETVDCDNSTKRKVNILEQVYGVTQSGQNCYEMTENVDMKKHPVFLVNALTQAVSFDFFSKKELIDSKDLFHNSYFKLPETFNNISYFCIKKYIDKEHKKLEDSAYNFQIYYEDDLENNQMFIMPLANGRIYTHTLSQGKIMAYRHTCYTGNAIKEEVIYSANLLVIKGKPELYGYICEKYPNCTVNGKVKGLEPVERINQYYVNKRLEAEGNVEVDKYSEPVSEIRKQYLSVVICNSEEDCEYTIEINNQGNDVQLCPGRMYATHVIPGTNYFSVKISNFKEIKKLNITLTALTGNAYMNIYDDFNLEKKTTNYIHHKLFRKEVFEFNSPIDIERYWGVIVCTEPAFIEMTYMTDLDSNGYIMANPGEINIEYINKKGTLFPYNIAFNETFDKEKEYFFKIRTKECSMLYNYKNVNYSGIKTVDKIFNSSQNNINFMSTVDKYNYNTNNDSTDCAMIFYSGEINSYERPLLILGDYPIPSNLENNYFIYPFFKGDKYFKGVLIDIRFTNTNNGKPNYKVILFVNNNKIIEERNITGNVIIPVNGSDEKLDCGNNLHCSLKIHITKNEESDAIYNFTINVYSKDSSIPEIIDNTQSTNNLYIYKGNSKTIKIDIGKDEETEIEINYIKGQGKVQAKLIPKSQMQDSNIYIFSGDSNNLFSFYSNNRKIAITKEQSNKCDGGCELVLLIQMDDDNIEGDIGEVSITKSSLTQEVQTKQESDSGKKVDAWLTAVLCIVCAIVVAAILILIYCLVLKKKNNNNITPIKRTYVVNQKPSNYYNNNYGNYSNIGNSAVSSNRQFNNYNNTVNNNALNKLNNNYNNSNIATSNVNYNIAKNNYNNINNNFKSNVANNYNNISTNYNNNLVNNYNNNFGNSVNNIPNNKANK